MITLDGLILNPRPITFAELGCGCILEYNGHEIEVGEIVDCDMQETCTNIFHGPAQIRRVVRTGVLDCDIVHPDTDPVATPAG
ncbi:hypothetical protein CFP71_10105 [Amycolatopsis thailandensis]|uniref:Uncharacterized protein n=1 Tax=Amycolatopsis thailandensis TaxID=589330 RepID=A0A229SEC6_9PSEU|nr:hypothetical protein [Amycolatopsis thailandensis]OXM57079.1 hypothetical protein CFP71_10105 [Amycolatopsis thailandensis]